MPVASGQDTLDPRQEKAREEFQKMREQLRRTLERTIEPAPWREQATASEPPPPQRLPAPRPQPLATVHPVPAGRWIEVISIAGASFVMGCIVTLAVVGMGHKAPASGPGVAAAAESTAHPARNAAVPSATSPTPSLGAQLALARETPPAVKPSAPLAVAAQPPASATEPAPQPPLSAAFERPAESASPKAPPGATPAPASAPVKQEAVKPEAPKQEAAKPETSPGVKQEAVVNAETAPGVKQEAPPPPISPAQTAQMKEMQALLKGLGYGPGPGNGLPGAKMLKAADAFAKRYGLADSNLDAAFLAALRKADATKLTPPAKDADGKEPVADRVQRIREIQGLLNTLGHPIGKPNGIAGPKTTEAANAFATEEDLADSNLDEAFLALLQEKAAAPH
jgi:peptidoglycan hydrolase-like protein with peptidoglycan-binding domain